MRRFAVILAMLEGLYMCIDGVRALMTGSYFAPGGRIGPWAAVVSAAHISPFSIGMRVAFVAIGAAYIFSAAAYALRLRRSSSCFAAVAILTLWYVPLGTVLSLIVLAAILAGRPRRATLR